MNRFNKKLNVSLIVSHAYLRVHTNSSTNETVQCLKIMTKKNNSMKIKPISMYSQAVVGFSTILNHQSSSFFFLFQVFVSIGFEAFSFVCLHLIYGIFSFLKVLWLAVSTVTSLSLSSHLTCHNYSNVNLITSQRPNKFHPKRE